MSDIETTQKYAHATVVMGDDTEQWMVPIYDTHAGTVLEKEQERGRVLKQSQTQNDKKYTTRPWVEPRLNFKDLVSWLDLSIWHKRCVYLKAAVTCGLGWQLTTDEEDKTEDADFERISEFLENPNEDPTDNFTRIAFRSAVDYYATGNLINEASRQYGSEEIGNLYHQRAMKFRRDKNTRTGGYYQVPDVNTMHSYKGIPFSRWGYKEGDQNEILHHYLYDPCSDYYGMPIWVPALADMVLDRSSVEFNINLFQNQLVAKFAVIVEGGKLSKDGKESLRQFLRSQATGSKNAGKTLVLDVDDPNIKVKIEKLELEFGDKQGFMGKTRESSRNMIISAHGVPPRMVGIVAQGQLGGGNEALGQLKIFAENDIGPEQNMIANYYNSTVLASFGDHKWKLEFNMMDYTDKKIDAEVAVMLKNAGLILPEEGREDLNYSALDDDTMERLSSNTNQGGLPVGLQNSLSAIRKRMEESGEY